MEEPTPRPTAHRDVPAWGWALIVLARVWTLVPLVLLTAGIWWWTHGGSKQAPKWIRQALHHARTTVDSALGR